MPIANCRAIAITVAAISAMLAGGLFGLARTASELGTFPDHVSTELEQLGPPREDREDIPQPGGSIPANNPKPDVVFIPTPTKVVEEMLYLAAVKQGEVVFDLGSGDGRIPIMAAGRFGARAFGYEIDADLVRQSQEAVRKHKLEDRVTIERRDIFQLDLTRADVVTLYLLPSLNEKLLPQLEKMRSGARIVSHDFEIPGIRAKSIKRLKATDERNHTREHWIYLWTVPLEKERRW
jgi:hypothetical protein